MKLGTVMILKIFSPKNLVKKWRSFVQHTASFFCKILIIALVFKKNAIFFSEHWRK
jgi:hypothetical protein